MAWYLIGMIVLPSVSVFEIFLYLVILTLLMPVLNLSVNVHLVTMMKRSEILVGGYPCYAQQTLLPLL
jgi:hypothetical protein